MKTKLLLVLSLLSILMIVALAQSAEKVSLAANSSINTTWCNDTDTGLNNNSLNFFLQGKTSSNLYPRGIWDTCGISNGKLLLREYYCVGNSLSLMSKDCSSLGSFSCLNGACINITIPRFCNDTDAINYTSWGVVYSQLYPQGKQDYCQNYSEKQYVFEGYCRGNDYGAFQKNCLEVGLNFPCRNGACRRWE